MAAADGKRKTGNLPRVEVQGRNTEGLGCGPAILHPSTPSILNYYRGMSNVVMLMNAPRRW